MLARGMTPVAMARERMRPTVDTLRRRPLRSSMRWIGALPMNHHVRDFTYDEDRCRAKSRRLPCNLACLTNAAISIVRLNRRFSHLPQANRHYAARQGEALREVVRTPPRR